jgi:UDP-3-O-[3-hydroxymyristoyl] glucosamine N-acyltransferase
MRLQDLATALSAHFPPDSPVEIAYPPGSQPTPDLDITSVATLEDARPGQLSFLANPRYASQLATTQASAVLAAPNAKSDRLILLKSKDPYFAFRNALITLVGFRKHPHEGIHPLAYVHPTATVGPGTTIYPGCYVGPRARIGRDCILYPNVVVYDDCVLGDRVTLHACCSIGHDGFGYATHALKGQPPAHHKIPQAGNAVIEDDVELGAGCTVDRATLGSTVIGRGTKFSNLVAIGHGTKVGPHNLYVAQVGLAGSVTTGAYVVMGGQAGIAGHLKIGDQVQISAKAGVMEDVEPKSIMLGAPAMPAGQARRVFNHFLNLDELAKRIKELEKKVESLEEEKAAKNP